jgi:hypothetical protein
MPAKMSGRLRTQLREKAEPRLILAELPRASNQKKKPVAFATGFFISGCSARATAKVLRLHDEGHEDAVPLGRGGQRGSGRYLLVTLGRGGYGHRVAGAIGCIRGNGYRDGYFC